MSASEQLYSDLAQVELALESLRDFGDRPGMYEEGERAVEALHRVENVLQRLRSESQKAPANDG